MSALKPPARRTARVTTPDGIGIAAEAFGAEPFGTGTRPGIVFIHGFSQSSLCWSRQTASPLLSDFQMVTYDFRGHGASDKPEDPARYKAAELWAGEVDAVIRTFGLERPVLVGWSYAGRIIGDYVTIFGTKGISGIVYVDAVTANERRFYGSCNRLMRQMCSPDVTQNITATRAFLRRCFANPIPQPLFELMFGVNMLVPHNIRAALFDRVADYDAVNRTLDVPVLVVQGALDEVVAPAMAEHITEIVPNARLDLFEGAGHAPFLEAPERFNAALAAFVREVAGKA
ncbi:alpha/beta fold hydrolase [Xanthobacter oligotrophicus]|uniref:alpha/beta fold hydrolase n=1 Tax=Xanthobacter oligotrophicus TaxID=2607286 RepID=UPI0011F360F5|nr:alpha/beta hydrolase [Xanthobacter oligotrophicus]MCG5235922.1 alpha/beta hydrolase [Xanthobacter oligotrophicus]